jgi:hypothetical protein
MNTGRAVLATPTQPQADAIDETVLNRVDDVVRLAGKHRIDVQIAPLTGWMSGYFLLPPWARGDLFADPKALAAEQRLVDRMAARYRGNPAVQGSSTGPTAWTRTSASARRTASTT